MYPFKYEELDEETDAAIKRDFKAYTRGLVKIKPHDICMPPEFMKYGERIYNMEFRPDDIFVITFPKTGTTWTQTAIWSILNGGRLELLEDCPLLYHWKFLELDAILKDGMDRLISKNAIQEQFVAAMEGGLKQFESTVTAPTDKPRLIKTHMPLSFLPPKLLDTSKVVYVARNVKDTCVSWYHHHKFVKTHDFEGDFETFCDYFMRDLTMWSPFWHHVIEAWNRRHHPNMLFLFYEDMKEDFPAALRKLATFIEKPISEETLTDLDKKLTVEEMKKNPALNLEEWKTMGVMSDGEFIRKGIVGDWKNHFTPELEMRMNEWSKEQRRGCDIRFPGEE